MRMVSALASLLALAAWSYDTPKCTQNDLNAWMAHSLQEMETIHAGMSREAMLKVFQPEPGFFRSTRSKGMFVYRNCPYIHVDVDFTPEEGGDQHGPESPKDVITSISRPYLGQPVYD